MMLSGLKLSVINVFLFVLGVYLIVNGSIIFGALFAILGFWLMSKAGKKQKKRDERASRKQSTE